MGSSPRQTQSNPFKAVENLHWKQKTLSLVYFPQNQQNGLARTKLGASADSWHRLVRRDGPSTKKSGTGISHVQSIPFNPSRNPVKPSTPSCLVKFGKFKFNWKVTKSAEKNDDVFQKKKTIR